MKFKKLAKVFVLPALAAVLAVPIVAQQEVDPDHFDSNAPSAQNKKATAQNQKTANAQSRKRASLASKSRSQVKRTSTVAQAVPIVTADSKR